MSFVVGVEGGTLDFLTKSVSFCGDRSWQNGMFRDFQDLKPISSGQVFINLSLQIFAANFTFCHTEVVISCGMSSSKWMPQMAFWQSWNRPKERKSGAVWLRWFLQWLQVAGLWGAKLKNCLKVWICGFCLSIRTLVSCLSKEKARPEFQVMHILLLLDSFFCWFDSNTFFSGKARCHWSSGCNPRAFRRCGLGDMEDPGT